MTSLVMTLEEMLRLALGTATPDRTNLTVLHSFLEIVIRQLDLKSIQVEVSGPEACELRQMLCRARDPSIEFKTCEDAHEGEVTAMEERINSLMEAVTKLETDLKDHLDAAKKCQQPTPTELKKKRKKAEEQEFSSEDEDLCELCDPENLIACSLLRNTGFLKRLMRTSTGPVVERLFELEKTIRILNENFQNFLNLAEDEYKKIPTIEDCLTQITALEGELKSQKVELIRTMEEVQEMLDAKMDKVHIPAFKKYIMDRLDEVQRRLDEIMNKEQCPKAAGVIMSNLQCLCCTSRVCQKDAVFPVPLMAAVSAADKIKRAKDSVPKLCIPADRERACGGSHTVIRAGERSLQTSNLIDDFGDKQRLRIGHENVEYFKGTDGGMYRLAPDNDGHL